MSTLTIFGRPCGSRTIDFLVASALDVPSGTVAVIEGPDTAFIGGQGAGQLDADTVIARRSIYLALAIALAEFQKLAGAIDAKPLDRIARPAPAIALARKAALGREHAVALCRGNVALEIGLVAEQAEPVLDLPLDAQHAATKLGVGRSAHQVETRGSAGR